MTSSQAGFIAKQGLSMLYNATVTSVSAISTGIGMAYKTYTDHYEKNQIETLKKSGRKPADVIHEVLQRMYYLSQAGYNNEVAAASQKIAAKLTSGGEKSTVTFECVAALSGVLVTTCSKYGDLSTGGWGLGDFLNSARMGKDHFDRDQLVSDLYFAFLFAQDVAGGPGAEFESMVREAAGRMVEGDGYVSNNPAGYGSSGAYTPSAYTSTSGLPSYASASAFGSSSAKPSSSGFGSASANVKETDPKKKAAKVLGVLASSIKKAVDEADSKRVRSLKEAEDMLHREKSKAAQQGGGAPMPTAFGSTTPGVSSSFGGGSTSGFGGATAKQTGFGSGSSYGAAGGSSFGGASTGVTAFGSGSTYGGSSGGSGFGGGSSFGGGASSATGFGSNTQPSGGGGWANFGSGNSGYNSVGAPSNPPQSGYGGSSTTPGQGNFLGL